MRQSWFDPYVWVHVAGIVMFPLWMGLCAIGLASAEPVLPVWLEMVTIVVLGAGSILAMQLLKPFNIFSALMIAIPTDCLDDDHRRILAIFQEREQQILAIVISALMCCFLIDAYHLAPLLERFSPVRIAPGSGISRIILATVGFLGGNLFLQVPLATLRVMAMPDAAVAQVTPVQVEDAAEQFTTLGWQWAGLLMSSEGSEPVIFESELKENTCPSSQERD
ncbi:MAG: low-complexity tail membrane protein [Synechococcus sp.]